jgi:hypothetical protein
MILTITSATIFRRIVLLFLYSQYLFIEIFFITICWMICTRFRHLNKTIENMSRNNLVNIENLKKLINCWGINIKQIALFNKIFSLPMAVFSSLMSLL